MVSQSLLEGTRRCATRWRDFRTSPSATSRKTDRTGAVAAADRNEIDLAGVPLYYRPTGKVSPGRQFTGKNPSRPGGRWTGWIFAGKLSAEGDFSGGGSYNGTPAPVLERSVSRVVPWCGSG